MSAVDNPRMRIGTSLDKAAIGFSTLCIVHCLLLPIAVILLPSVSALTVLEDELFHLLLLVLVLPTSVIALMLGCKRHRSLTVMMLGISGLTILTITAIFGHDLVGATGERMATVFGASVLAAGHLLNYRFCQEHH